MARAGKAAVHRITTVGSDEPADLASRERAYLIMMAIRFVAIVVAVVVPGFWRWVAIAAGVILPYVAVVTVNATRTRGTPADPAFWPDHKTAIASGPVVPPGPDTAPQAPPRP